MENIRLSSMISYENWVKKLNQNTRPSTDSRMKPQVPSSQIRNPNQFVKREKKLATSELWIG